MSDTVIILDNGASTIKTGIVSGGGATPCRLIPNAVIKSKGDKTTYFGHEFERCRDYSSLHYRLPFEKGYIVDWDAQKAIWDGIFSGEVLGVNTTTSTLFITEPCFNLPNIQEVYDQFVFEEYEFQSYYRCPAPAVVPHGTLFSHPGLPQPECMLIIDSGFSFTHVVPMINGGVVWEAVKRIDVGGKLLTNHLKELVSFRQWNMMDETYIMNHVKETCCYVSTNFNQDLEFCRANPKSNPIAQEYILPDLSTNRKGRVRQPLETKSDTDQILVMNNERFTVPEILFRPDDIGLEQMGLAPTVALCISLLPEDLQGMFWANIGLIGGNTRFPGFRSRLFTELRSLAPVDYEVCIYECDDPITEAYKASCRFVTSPDFFNRVLTRAEYAESGSSASRRKFYGWKSFENDRERQKDAPKLKGKQREDDRPSQTTSRLGRSKSRTNLASSAGARKR